MIYVWMVGISSAVTYSVFSAISEATGLPFSDLNAGTGYMFLLFGWGCRFWQPIALTHERRGVYLISFLGTIAIILIRNTLNFRFNYGITPWITASGLQNMFVAIAMISHWHQCDIPANGKIWQVIQTAPHEEGFVESGVGH
jgi:hypothetical protein